MLTKVFMHHHHACEKLKQVTNAKNLNFVKRFLRGKFRGSIEVSHLPKVAENDQSTSSLDKSNYSDIFSKEKNSRLYSEPKFIKNMNANHEITQIDSRIKEISMHEANQYYVLSNHVTSLWKKNYGVQLKIKQKYMIRQLMKFNTELRQAKVKFKKINNLCCDVEDVRSAMVITRYRNKSEFSIGRGIDGNPKTVGYFMNNVSGSDEPICVNPIRINVLKESHIKLAMEFQNYIRASSLSACSNVNEDGFWLGLTIHCNKDDDLMVTVVTRDCNLNQELLNEEEEKLKKFFSSLENDIVPMSLHRMCCFPSQQPLLKLISGKSYLYEEISGIKFQIVPLYSPLVNFKAHESYNDLIRRLCFLEDKTCIINVNSGFGILGMYLSKYCSKVVNIEAGCTLKSEIEKTLESNGISNVELYFDNIENSLDTCVNSLEANNVILILHLGKSSFSSKAIRIIREANNIKRLLITSTGLEENTRDSILKFCKTSSDKFKTAPFKMIYISPIDMMPQTKYVDVISLLER